MPRATAIQAQSTLRVDQPPQRSRPKVVASVQGITISAFRILIHLRIGQPSHCVEVEHQVLRFGAGMNHLAVQRHLPSARQGGGQIGFAAARLTYHKQRSPSGPRHSQGQSGFRLQDVGGTICLLTQRETVSKALRVVNHVGQKLS
ncbi:hypothetical protein FQZ97_1075330 [compost metagenome]